MKWQNQVLNDLPYSVTVHFILPAHRASRSHSDLALTQMPADQTVFTHLGLSPSLL